MTSSNRLINETSPYLQQHAHNPVDWYPWGDEALNKARIENKPILLSIGYAACHWCHVMAHESFEDKATADVMNNLFVNIKVDREERPDLDKIYQLAHYALTGHGGGWPLTVFLTPDDLVPFFSGTYFPLEASHGMPAFKSILTTIADVYRTQPQEIKQQNASLVNLLQQKASPNVAVTFNLDVLKAAYDTLVQAFDQRYGGFGAAPKFPQPARLEFLLQYEPKSPMTMFSLEAMAAGGLYDQLGGGFYRYSVDAAWQIPHFEKMLYDNGQLLHLYARAAAFYKNEYFAHIAEQVATWAINEMQAPEGGYYSSIDADAEGVEGKFYVWNKEQIASLLSAEENAVVSEYYGFNQAANFEHEWHLHVAKPLDTIASELQLSIPKVRDDLHSAHMKLLHARNQRVRPHTDQKILTAWNALMIKGMVQAAALLNDAEIQNSADRATEFIKNKLWDGKQLYVSYKDGKTSHPGFLDDYVFLIDALLDSIQFQWNSEYLNLAIQLADQLLEKFEDKTAGGFFFTPETHEKLLYRPKSFMDEALPSGNGVAARVLILLSALTGEAKYLKAAEKTLQAGWDPMSRFPAEHTTLLLALEEFVKPSQIIIIRGENPEELKQWQKQTRKLANYVFAIPSDAGELPDLIAQMKPKNKISAYICEGHQCTGAIENLEELKKL